MNGDANPVHVRLLERIPRERITTHEAPPPPFERALQGRPRGNLPARRRATIAELRGQINAETGKRWTQYDLAALLGISQVAVRKHMRALDGKR